MDKQGSASFCEQKEAKKLFDSGPWALKTTTPHIVGWVSAQR
jgi:hypothetical protein